MSLLPPELDRPFSSHAERVAAREQLARRDATLRLIEALAAKPEPEWSPAELSAFPHTTNGVEDPAPRRTRRWSSLFAEEIAEVHRLGGSRRPLSDVELREALYLAGRLLSTVTDLPIAIVDEFKVP
ncbi:MAG TPA: hypothetical protein VMF65_08300 [Acidimicrobiales bacterium]|nr:hypothetical protein [Acidimicrobiales bacterium]